MTNIKETEEYKRLEEANKEAQNQKKAPKQKKDLKKDWRRWGPYVSDRQWGTVRENYSDAWQPFCYDKARSNTYRWGEDGIFGISDDGQRLCFALAFWNGEDEHIKERFFGLSGGGKNPGNHGEDVKEYYFYLDNTPTHSYMKALYKYPHQKFPYEALKKGHQHRQNQPEYELIDTEVFDQESYFDIFVEYAKGETTEDILIKIEICNRGTEKHELHVIPMFWFRDTWSWSNEHISRPCLELKNDKSDEFWWVVEANYNDLSIASKPMRLYCEKPEAVLFTENQTNPDEDVFPDRKPRNSEEYPKFYKDGINNYIFDKFKKPDVDCCRSVNTDNKGTKAGIHYHFKDIGKDKTTIFLRLTSKELSQPFKYKDFHDTFEARIKEADNFYNAIQQDITNDELKRIQRQAFAGMLWSKQFYNYDVKQWMQEQLKPNPINSHWEDFQIEKIIAMPDKWEFPYFATWDSAFQAVTLALIDSQFAKEQLLLVTKPGTFMSPGRGSHEEGRQIPAGQIPGCEFEFDNVNPPVLAWAAWKVYEIEKGASKDGDKEFLRNICTNLLNNFDWWIKEKKIKGEYAFGGGFLGLDNISIINRNQFHDTKQVKIKQVDAAAWVAMFCLNLLHILIELGADGADDYPEKSVEILEVFLKIAHNLNKITANDEKEGRVDFWDIEDYFYYDILHIEAGEQKKAPFAMDMPLKYRSILGIIPLFAVEVFDLSKSHAGHPNPVVESLCKFLNSNRIKDEEFKHLHGHEESFFIPEKKGENSFLTIVNKKKLVTILDRLLNEEEFLGARGIRSLSKFHLEHPYELDGLVTNQWDQHLAIEMKYEPAETQAHVFSPNSNWRGPIWFQINYLIIESLKKFHIVWGDIQRPYPTLSKGKKDKISLFIEKDKKTNKYINNDNAVALELACRLISIFMPQESNNEKLDEPKKKYRPVYGYNDKIQDTFAGEQWQDLILFYEHFNGDNGAGLGASHQTGWTGLVANLIHEYGEYYERHHGGNKSI